MVGEQPLFVAVSPTAFCLFSVSRLGSVCRCVAHPYTTTWAITAWNTADENEGNGAHCSGRRQGLRTQNFLSRFVFARTPSHHIGKQYMISEFVLLSTINIVS
jgi:hypothetical protein